MPNKAPGLSRRKRKSGEIVYYWVARFVSRAAVDYPTKTVRLHGTMDEIAERCQALTGELYEWLEGATHTIGADFDGSVSSLIDCYTRDPDSPYRDIKPNTRRQYDESLKILRPLLGSEMVDEVTRRDFTRVHREARYPEGPEGPDRMRRAHHVMKLVRIIVNYGASERFTGCADAAMILSKMKFPLPAPRRKRLAYEHAVAVIEEAIKQERYSIALAQALQFELSLRQKDVIGEWTYRPGEASGITHMGSQWSGGVLWSDVSDDLVLTKQTTKTATIGEWGLMAYPLIVRALEYFPPDKRVGPMIVSERTGYPYRADPFRLQWREIATKAGVPNDIWNMDSRAGGITEASDAGAEPKDIQLHATHSNFATTSRYIRGTRPATDNVAQLRVKKRSRPNGEQ